MYIYIIRLYCLLITSIRLLYEAMKIEEETAKKIEKETAKKIKEETGKRVDREEVKRHYLLAAVSPLLLTLPTTVMSLTPTFFKAAAISTPINDEPRTTCFKLAAVLISKKRDVRIAFKSSIHRK